MKKQFDLDGINENAEEKVARAKGVGAHLHLQMFLGDWKTDLAFFNDTLANTNSIKTRGAEIYNPCNYDDSYFNNK